MTTSAAIKTLQGATGPTGATGTVEYAADTGAANAYVVTLSPVPTLTAGLTFAFLAANGCTGPSTMNPNSLGPTPIKKLNGTTALVNGDIVAGQIVVVVYDGTNFQMVSASAIMPPGGVVSGTPIVQAPEYYSSTSSNWANYSLWFKIPGSQIQCNPASWIVRFAFTNGTGFHIAAANVMRVTRQTGVVLDVTVITFGGNPTLTGTLSSPSITNPNVFSTDTISLQIDGDHDYWVLFYFDTDGGGLNAGVGVGRNTSIPPSLGNMPMGHTTGNQSITATNSMTLTEALTTATQYFFWDVRAA